MSDVRESPPLGEGEIRDRHPTASVNSYEQESEQRAGRGSDLDRALVYTCGLGREGETSSTAEEGARGTVAVAGCPGGWPAEPDVGRVAHGLPAGLDRPLTVGSLFAGIGGIDLGLERTGGFRTAWFSEVDPYASAVLARHWPDVPNFGDVRAITDAPHVDVLAGGFPCQPVSLAGRRLGEFDPRWLWPEFARLVGELRPRIVLVENVPGLASKGLRDVVADLSTLGYDAEWDVVSAAAVGAPHLRERLFLIAYPERRELRIQPGRGGRTGGEGAPFAGVDGEAQPLADANDLGRDGRPGIFWTSGGTEPAYSGPIAREAWPAEPDVGRVAHGVPHRMDRLRCLGNGVVPQVAEFVGHLILEAVGEGRL